MMDVNAIPHPSYGKYDRQLDQDWPASDNTLVNQEEMARGHNMPICVADHSRHSCRP